MDYEESKAFWRALHWVLETWWQHRFFVQRDVVWTIQKRLIDEPAAQSLSYRVHHNYKMPDGTLAALALVGRRGHVALALKVKYEPDHDRTDNFLLGKLTPSVVTWTDVAQDVERVNGWVAQGYAQEALALLFDEGWHFRQQILHPGSRWETRAGVPLLIAEG